MRRLPSITVDRGGHAGLPAMVEELLVDMVNDGFALYCCGQKAAPNALVTCYEWDHYVDLLTIRDFDRIVTARMPKRESVDIFAPAQTPPKGKVTVSIRDRGKGPVRTITFPNWPGPTDDVTVQLNDY